MPSPLPHPVLIFLAGPNAGRRYELIQGDYIIGRRSDCQIFVPDMRVSRQHARIYRDGNAWRVEDLGSNNGTLVNGENVLSAELGHDDEIAVAENRMRVDMPTQGVDFDQSVTIVDLDNPAVYMSRQPVSAAAASTGTGTDKDKGTGTGARRMPLPSSLPPLPMDPDSTRLLERKLHALQSILEIAARVAEPDELMASVVDQLLEVFPKAESVGVLVDNERTGKLEVRCHRRRSNPMQKQDFGGEMRVPGTIIDIVVRDHRGVLMSDSRTEPEPRDSAPLPLGSKTGSRPNPKTGAAELGAGVSDLVNGPNLAQEANGSRMGAPLQARNTHYGVMYVACKGHNFRQEDLDLLTSIAAQTGLAIHAARMHARLMKRGMLERDLRVARQIQRSLMRDPPDVQGLDFAVHYEAAYQIGGDFYDFIWHDNEHLGLMVGDVSGKAISAALYMARLTSEIRGRVGIAQTPARLLERVNEEMVKLGDDGMFATLVYAVYDLTHKILAYTNAGHCKPLLRRADRVFPLYEDKAHIPPVGVMTGLDIGEAQVQLYQGDLLVFVSDGVLEARSPLELEYGEERLARCIQRAPAEADAVIQSILEDVDRHVANGQQGDDITVLAMKVDSHRARRASSTIAGYASPDVADVWDGRG